MNEESLPSSHYSFYNSRLLLACPNKHFKPCSSGEGSCYHHISFYNFQSGLTKFLNSRTPNNSISRCVSPLLPKCMFSLYLLCFIYCRYTSTSNLYTINVYIIKRPNWCRGCENSLTSNYYILILIKYPMLPFTVLGSFPRHASRFFPSWVWVVPHL